MKHLRAIVGMRSKAARLVALYFEIAVIAVASGLGFGLPWRLVIPITSACAALAVVEIGRARLALVRRRRKADALLRTGVRVHPASDLLVWRAAELTSDRNRRVLSRSLSGIVRELERPPFISPVPLDRRAVRPYVALVAALAARVGQLERPVSARGMVLVEELLTDGFASPLYLGGRCEEVPVALERCHEALEDAGRNGGVVVDLADRFRGGPEADFGGPRAHSGGSH